MRWPRLARLSRSRIGQTLGGFLSAFIVVFVIESLDILGIYSNLEPLSNLITERVMAPAYSHRDKPSRTNPHPVPQITVVLVDSEYMKLPGGKSRGWPLAANDFLNNVLRPVIDAKPKAVFVDITFTDMPRPVSLGSPIEGEKGTTTLARGIRLASQTVPIFLSTTYPINDGDDIACRDDWVDQVDVSNEGTLSKTFRNTAFALEPGKKTQLEVVTANWLKEGYPIASALVATPQSCKNRHQTVPDLYRDRMIYRQEPDRRPPASMTGGYLLSPAAAIFMRLCTASSVPCLPITPLDAPAASGGPALYALDHSMQVRMQVQWGSRQSSLMRHYFSGAERSDRCIMQNATAWPFGYVSQALYAVFPWLDSWLHGSRRPCPFIDTLTVSQLRDPGKFGLTSAQSSKFLTAFLHDRIAMIGTALPYVPDFQVSPVNGEVPGVYIHAMALSNLFNYGSNFRRLPGFGAQLLEKIIEAFLVASLAMLIPRAFERTRRWWQPPHQASRPGIRHFLVFHFALFAVGLAVLVAAIIAVSILDHLGHFVPASREVAASLSVVFITLSAMVSVMVELQQMIFGDKNHKLGRHHGTSGPARVESEHDTAASCAVDSPAHDLG